MYYIFSPIIVCLYFKSSSYQFSPVYRIFRDLTPFAQKVTQLYIPCFLWGQVIFRVRAVPASQYICRYTRSFGRFTATLHFAPVEGGDALWIYWGAFSSLSLLTMYGMISITFVLIVRVYIFDPLILWVDFLFIYSVNYNVYYNYSYLY